MGPETHTRDTLELFVKMNDAEAWTPLTACEDLQVETTAPTGSTYFDASIAKNSELAMTIWLRRRMLRRIRSAIRWRQLRRHIKRKRKLRMRKTREHNAES